MIASHRSAMSRSFIIIDLTEFELRQLTALRK